MANVILTEQTLLTSLILAQDPDAGGVIKNNEMIKMSSTWIWITKLYVWLLSIFKNAVALSTFGISKKWHTVLLQVLVNEIQFSHAATVPADIDANDFYKLSPKDINLF